MRFGRTYGNHFKGSRRRFAGRTSPVVGKHSCRRAVLRRLCAQVKAGKIEIDYTAFRLAYAASSKYAPYGTIEIVSKLKKGLRCRRLPISDGAREGGV